jgi:hypothetical protein
MSRASLLGHDAFETGLTRVEVKLDRVIEQGAASAAPTPEDLDDISRDLATHRGNRPGFVQLGLTTTIDHKVQPSGYRVPVPTTIVSRLHVPPLGSFTIAEAVDKGLLSRAGRWQPWAFEKLCKAAPGVVPAAALSDPRAHLLAQQRAAQARHPHLWHTR